MLFSDQPGPRPRRSLSPSFLRETIRRPASSTGAPAYTIIGAGEPPRRAGPFLFDPATAGGTFGRLNSRTRIERPDATPVCLDRVPKICGVAGRAHADLAGIQEARRGHTVQEAAAEDSRKRDHGEAGPRWCSPESRHTIVSCKPHVRHTVPAPSRTFPLRNCLSDPPQVPRWHGSAGSAARSATMSKSTKPGSAAVRAARAGAFTTNFLSPAPLKCECASREPSSMSGRAVATQWGSRPVPLPRKGGPI